MTWSHQRRVLCCCSWRTNRSGPRQANLNSHSSNPIALQCSSKIHSRRWLQDKAASHHPRSGHGLCQNVGPPDDSALLKIIEVSTRQMTNVCKRQHVDVTDPTLAFAIHLCHELQSLPADLQSDAKLELHKVVNQFHKKGWSLLSH